ncbi:MAG: hypothetical protein IPJ76_06370 [Flavobacteriales bacterium]|nr:MAG: hypothetical protein IPJ76_06370 [Flavobacteriales bacterium]
MNKGQRWCSSVSKDAGDRCISFIARSNTGRHSGEGDTSTFEFWQHLTLMVFWELSDNLSVTTRLKSDLSNMEIDPPTVRVRLVMNVRDIDLQHHIAIGDIDPQTGNVMKDQGAGRDEE